MEVPLKEKLEDLRKRIRKLDSALIAFSGGVDSAFLTRICREELGEKAVAVTAQSSTYPHSELIMAKRIAKILGVKHVVYDPATDEHSHGKGPSCNSANIYSALKCLAMRMKLKSVLDASHRDDLSERRKRFIAAKSAGVRSPLLESQLTKAEIRVLAKELGLPNWDKPASGCGRVVKTRSRLSKALLAKRALDSLGAKDACVRMSGKKITIMARSREMGLLVRKFDLMHRKLRSLGFTEILLKPRS